MPENVAVPDGDESPEPQAPATPPEEDIATVKARLAGKDRAYTELKREADRIAREAEDLRRWKAEKEQADLTEMERIQLALKQAQADAEQARAEAARERLARKYPEAVATYRDGDPLPSEETLAALNERLAKAATPAAEPEAEPRIDPNRARRSVAPPAETTAKDILAAINSTPLSQVESPGGVHWRRAFEE